MNINRYRRKIRTLWVMVVLAIIYAGLIYILHTLTGVRLVDGGIGVVLGLYISSHPAANAVDLMFMQRGAWQQLSSEWSGIRWLALNMLVMLAGWVVIVIGAARFYYG